MIVGTIPVLDIAWTGLLEKQHRLLLLLTLANYFLHTFSKKTNICSPLP